MKIEQKVQAIALRQSGLSINKIAKQLQVSKASVSSWVKDVILTADQIDELGKNSLFGAQVRKIKARAVRSSHQDGGRSYAKQHNWLHVAGCMLYWGEGTKHKNKCEITNSDPDLLKFFLKFLYQCYNVTADQVRFSVNVHLGSGLSIEQIEEYWTHVLCLPKTCFNKSIINQTSSASLEKKAKNKLPYGTARICVHSTEIAQSIYGAIQEYSGSLEIKYID